MEESQRLSKLKKLQTLQEEPNLLFFDELEELINKLEAIQGSVNKIDTKETKTYENELETLLRGLYGLTQAVKDKDTIVNVPLDKLSENIKQVEQAIKNIKEVKIPDFPSEISLNETQINELLLAIQSIPEFPVKELFSVVNELGKKIEAIKLEEKETPEFDYEFLTDKFKELVRAIKSINIAVSGSGLGTESYNNGVDKIISTIQDTTGFQIPNYDEIALFYTGENLTGVVYKLATVTVATLTLGYTGTNLTSVIKS